MICQASSLEVPQEVLSGSCSGRTSKHWHVCETSRASVDTRNIENVKISCLDKNLCLNLCRH